jgi:hypothetical protein
MEATRLNSLVEYAHPMGSNPPITTTLTCGPSHPDDVGSGRAHHLDIFQRHRPGQSGEETSPSGVGDPAGEVSRSNPPQQTGPVFGMRVEQDSGGPCIVGNTRKQAR